MKLMTTSDNGLAVIKEFEGCRLKAYKCPAGVWTIGYGHTRGVKDGMTITHEIADKLLQEDVRPVERQINNFGINLRQGQFDALVSFIFNVGIGNFNASTLKRLIFAGADDEQIVKEFRKWDKATVNGKKVALPGLTKRRDKEAKMWLS